MFFSEQVFFPSPKNSSNQENLENSKTSQILLRKVFQKRLLKDQILLQYADASLMLAAAFWLAGSWEALKG